MTTLSGSSLAVGFIGDSNKQRSSPSISNFSSRRPFLIPCAVKNKSDAADLLRKPETAPEKVIFRPADDVTVDWEDEILAETVPLVNFAKMILHSGRYKNGERLSREHEKAVREKLLPYHPEYERKTQGVVNYIKVDNHPEHGNTRCMFVVWNNGEEIDFSYRKCVKGFIRRKYPFHAEGFIFKHLKAPIHRPMIPYDHYI